MGAEAEAVVAPQAEPAFQLPPPEAISGTATEIKADTNSSDMQLKLSVGGKVTKLCGGIEAYKERNQLETEILTKLNEARGDVDAAYSLGLIIRKDARVLDSIFFMPAYQAGIMPGMTIVAVNGRKFSGTVLHDALKAAKGGSEPIQLLVENNEYYKTYSVNYHEGDKFPHLVRDEGKPDLLSDMLRPHVAK
jgi:hypothetical protein